MSLAGHSTVKLCSGASSDFVALALPEWMSMMSEGGLQNLGASFYGSEDAPLSRGKCVISTDILRSLSDRGQHVIAADILRSLSECFRVGA